MVPVLQKWGDSQCVVVGPKTFIPVTSLRRAFFSQNQQVSGGFETGRQSFAGYPGGRKILRSISWVVVVVFFVCFLMELLDILEEIIEV